jgi:heme A synthase
MPPVVQRATLVGAAAVYAQMLVGALMRHLGAGLACVELPLCQGQLFPAGVHPNVLLHMTHRLLGLVVFAVVAAVAVLVLRDARRTAVRALAALLPLLALGQIALGVWSITSFLDVVPVTAHLGLAALLLGDLWSLHLVSRGELRAPAVPAVNGPAPAALPVDGVRA